MNRVLRIGATLALMMSVPKIPLPLAAGEAIAPPSPPAREAEEGFVTTPDGARLFYRRIGNGPQVAVVPLQMMLYPALSRLAAPKRTLVFYDVRNRGRSSAIADSTTLSIDEDVRDLEFIRAYFGFEKFTPIGWSYLGKMVVMYALAHPDRVERIVQLSPISMTFGAEYSAGLTATSQIPTADDEARLDELVRSGFAKKHPREFCDRYYLVENTGLVGDAAKAAQVPRLCDLENEWPTNLDRHFRAHITSARRDTVTVAQARRVTQRVLTIHGTEDRNAPYGGGREWASSLADARLLTVQGAAHATWIDEPALVLGAVDAFLAGRWPAGAQRVDRVRAP